VIDVGKERVLVLTRDYGRRSGSNAEVRLRGAGRDGKVTLAEFLTRDEDLKAVGLEE
jgi:hypothetical protein